MRLLVLTRIFAPAILLHDLDRGLAADRGDLALEVPDAGFLGVVADDAEQRRIGELDVLLAEPVRLALLLHEVALGDVELLELGVAGDADDLHPVLQRPRDALERVRGGDEHHLRKIVVDVEVVVVERAVLLGIEHLEQRRRRIAAEVGRHLVDLVEQEDRIAGSGLLHRLDDLAREARRCRCGDGRGSRPRRERRRATRGRTSGRCARAIDLPSEVLPTPGGPTRHRIGPLSCPTRLCTARYSRMRCFTFSRP